MCSPSSSSQMCMIPYERSSSPSFIVTWRSVWRAQMRKPPQPSSLWRHATARARWARAKLGAVCPHPGLAQWPSPCSSRLLAGPRVLPHRCLGLVVKYGWALLVVLLKYAFSKVHFGVFRVCACKTYKYQNLWRMLVINPISKFWWSYFLYFV